MFDLDKPLRHPVISIQGLLICAARFSVNTAYKILIETLHLDCKVAWQYIHDMPAHVGGIVIL